MIWGKLNIFGVMALATEIQTKILALAWGKKPTFQLHHLKPTEQCLFAEAFSTSLTIANTSGRLNTLVICYVNSLNTN